MPIEKSKRRQQGKTVGHRLQLHSGCLGRVSKMDRGCPAGTARIRMEEKQGAVTIFYRIGEREIRIIFRQGETKQFITENELQPMNRKQVLSMPESSVQD